MLKSSLLTGNVADYNTSPVIAVRRQTPSPCGCALPIIRANACWGLRISKTVDTWNVDSMWEIHNDG